MLNNSSDSPSSAWDRSRLHRYTFLGISEFPETAGAICVQGRIAEISRKGCYVNTPNTLGVGTPLRVIISCYEETFVTNATIIYVHEQIGMGIAFAESPESQSESLNSWLAGACPYRDATLNLMQP
jgi:hypothetical protein